MVRKKYGNNMVKIWQQYDKKYGNNMVNKYGKNMVKNMAIIW